jgi:hypothetical protein
MQLSAEELRRLLDYDPETGVFTWRANRGPNARAGATAGNLNHHGYIQIVVCRRKYQAHRLAWLHVYGKWPPHDIDHINLDRCDNRLANLRSATRSENLANTSVRADNTSGVKGVSWHKQRGKWAARARINGKYAHLGLFENRQEAAAAYARATENYFGEFARS